MLIDVLLLVLGFSLGYSLALNGCQAGLTPLKIASFMLLGLLQEVNVYLLANAHRLEKGPLNDLQKRMIDVISKVEKVCKA